MSDDDVTPEVGSEPQRIGRAAVKAAQAQIRGDRYAVIVIVREIPDGSIAVATSIVGNRPGQLRILSEAMNVVRSDGIVI